MSDKEKIRFASQKDMEKGINLLNAQDSVINILKSQIAQLEKEIKDIRTSYENERQKHYTKYKSLESKKRDLEKKNEELQEELNAKNEALQEIAKFNGTPYFETVRTIASQALEG
jgi:hypothetical protein